jgi:hypothetical protein
MKTSSDTTTMNYDSLVGVLGYKGSPLFSTERNSDLVDVSERHWVRAAFDAGIKGAYFFKTRPEEAPNKAAVRPAVYVAEADTEGSAKEIHRKLWNQGLAPFIIIVLPWAVRVYTGFAYHPNKPEIGKIDFIDTPTAEKIAQSLKAFHADAINRGEIWQHYSEKLITDGRVDTTLLAQLDELGKRLQKSPHFLSQEKAHALIGKFIYLSYLRARNILSDRWLETNDLNPQTLFNGVSFSHNITKKSFRKLIKAVESRFNGQLFPIAWGSRGAPKADDIQLVARIFSGQEDIGGQTNLPFLAYDFASIPVEFISSIYEQFLHDTSVEDEKKGRAEEDASNPEKNGAHYTPEPLADYLAAEMNSIRKLKQGMKVLDPCCGSGIFLVIAYRRMVELECNRKRYKPLTANKLREILVSCIYGIERNKTAAQISIFSLVLTLLNYVNPPELHRHVKFKFPTLSRGNIYVGKDFFDDKNAFWEKINDATKPFRFDWIIGNPPWVEADIEDEKENYFKKWYLANQKKYKLARNRTGESFACHAMDCLAQNGVAGLILPAKTLTNDQLADWRKSFFGTFSVRRLSNLSNLKPIIFSSVKHPVITLIYTHKTSEADKILHLGPFLANQKVNAVSNGRRKGNQQAWSIGFGESEIKWVPTREAATGDAMTWKLALWGTPRDVLAIRQLRQFFPTTLGNLVTKHRWDIALGVQLRKNGGTKKDPNEYERSIEGIRVFDHKSFVKNKGSLRIPSDCLHENNVGCFIRERGGRNGLKIISGPRLFLWQDFAAYINQDAIIKHSKVAIGQGSENEMKAIAAIWNSHFVSYLLFFHLSSEWGFGYNLIDVKDAWKMPFPELTQGIENDLVSAWNRAEIMESKGSSFEEIRTYFDSQASAIFGIPEPITLVVQEFFKIRYQLNNGVNPPALQKIPDKAYLKSYAIRLRDSLDNYLAGAAHHKLRVIYSDKGIAVSISLRPQSKSPFTVDIFPVSATELPILSKLLEAAESKFSQWAYVRKNMFIHDGDTLHLLKPAHLLEWTQTQALLDSSEIIAEITEAMQNKS